MLVNSLYVGSVNAFCGSFLEITFPPGTFQFAESVWSGGMLWPAPLRDCNPFSRKPVLQTPCARGQFDPAQQIGPCYVRLAPCHPPGLGKWRYFGRLSRASKSKGPSDRGRKCCNFPSCPSALVRVCLPPLSPGGRNRSAALGDYLQQAVNFKLGSKDLLNAHNAKLERRMHTA